MEALVLEGFGRNKYSIDDALLGLDFAGHLRNEGLCLDCHPLDGKYLGCLSGWGKRFNLSKGRKAGIDNTFRPILTSFLNKYSGNTQNQSDENQQDERSREEQNQNGFGAINPNILTQALNFLSSQRQEDRERASADRQYELDKQREETRRLENAQRNITYVPVPTGQMIQNPSFGFLPMAMLPMVASLATSLLSNNIGISSISNMAKGKGKQISDREMAHAISRFNPRNFPNKELALSGFLDHEVFLKGFDRSEEILVKSGIMKNGSKGENVKALQTILNSFGAKLKADGIFGKKTESALIAYQRKNGLKTDGIFGPITKRAMINSPLKETVSVETPTKILFTEVPLSDQEKEPIKNVSIVPIQTSVNTPQVLQVVKEPVVGVSDPMKNPTKDKLPSMSSPEELKIMSDAINNPNFLKDPALAINDAKDKDKKPNSISEAWNNIFKPFESEENSSPKENKENKEKSEGDYNFILLLLAGIVLYYLYTKSKSMSFTRGI